MLLSVTFINHKRHTILLYIKMGNYTITYKNSNGEIKEKRYFAGNIRGVKSKFTKWSSADILSIDSYSAGWSTWRGTIWRCPK